MAFLSYEKNCSAHIHKVNKFLKILQLQISERKFVVPWKSHHTNKLILYQEESQHHLKRLQSVIKIDIQLQRHYFYQHLNVHIDLKYLFQEKHWAHVMTEISVLI